MLSQEEQELQERMKKLKVVVRKPVREKQEIVIKQEEGNEPKL